MNLILFASLLTLIYPIKPTKHVITSLKLRIVHHNDMMYQLNGYDQLNNKQCTRPDKKCQGGAFQLASAIHNLRNDATSTGKTLLYLYAGNSLGGSIYNTLTRSGAIIDVLNLLRPDFMCLGMNDFDYGVYEAGQLLTGINIPIITTNMDISKQHNMKKFKLNKSFMRVIQNIRVGFIGYVSAQTPKFSNSHDILFEDEYEAVRRECYNLRQKGVQFIIAIGNANYDVHERIAKQAPLVDMIISGSSYFESTKMWNMETPEISESDYPVFKIKNGRKIPLLQLFGYTKYLGVIDLTFDEIGIVMHYNYTLDNLKSPTTWGPIESDIVLHILNGYMNRIKNNVVGHTNVQINSDGYKCYNSECLFGNMITDAMVENILTNYSSHKKKNVAKRLGEKISIAIIDAGTMSNALGVQNGNVTNYELHDAISNMEPMIIVTVQGKILYRTLEQNVLQRTLRRNFLHMSGLRVIYDYSKPAFKRVIQMKVVSTESVAQSSHITVKMKEYYNIIIPSFTLNQVKCLRIMKENAKSIQMTELNIIEMVEAQFRRYQFINPRLDERILILNSSNLYDINLFAIIASVVYFMVKMFY